MGSLSFAGIRFSAYPLDHDPVHVHGTYGGVRVIVDLLDDGTAALSKRKNSVFPGNAKKSDVKRIVMSAAAHWQELNELWEKAHGRA